MSHRMLFALFVLLAAAAPGVAQIRFADDFSGDLAGWDLVGAHAITIEDSGDPEHGGVLSLRPDGSVFALIKDSDEWGSVRVELDVLFPDDADNYLGFIYHYIASPERSDFASLYIKGNGSYVRANPWRDGNVSRLLYEEYRTPLEGDDAIRIGE